MTYQYKDLRAVKGYFRGNARFGRTTKLVHIPTGEVFFEGMGIVSKIALHRAFLEHQCRENSK